ncbi:MAG: CGNR zinc finger domain-containing protein [Reyranella sp.]
MRRCANPECSRLFLDDSRAGKRRHYHKSKAA